MKEPALYLHSLLHHIEATVLELSKELPKINGNDIEWAYEKLAFYYKKLSFGKEAEEPLSPIGRRQDLVDEILNCIDDREESNIDAHLINNPDTLHGEHQIASLNHLYVIAFKRLHESAKFWRKEHGANGYINFISNILLH